MRIENDPDAVAPLEPYLQERAEQYDTPQAMVRDGAARAENGAIDMLGGLGLMLAGGTVRVLTGEKHRRIAAAGKTMWVTGAVVAFYGVARMLEGDSIQNDGREIMDALTQGDAVLIPNMPRRM